MKSKMPLLLVGFYTVLYGWLWVRASFSMYPLEEFIWMGRLTFPLGRMCGPHIRRMDLGFHGTAGIAYLVGLTQWLLVIAISNVVKAKLGSHSR